MKCPYCSKDIADNAAFCQHCGQSIQTNSITDTATDRFWDAENANNKKEVARVQGEIARAVNKRKKLFKAFICLLICLVCLVAIIYYAKVVMPKNQYSKAIDLLNEGQYKEAYDIFNNLDDYEESQKYIKQCETGIAEINYVDAVNKYNQGDYSVALNMFLDLDGYKESNMYVANCEKTVLASANEGDIVKFGIYDWNVLNKTNESILLISNEYVDEKIANEYSGPNKNGQFHCWSQSTLRNWLNTSFLNNSFSSDEIALLIKNKIVTDEYDVDGYDGWDENEIQVTTEDMVYIPSKTDIEKYNIPPMPEKESTYYNDDNNNACWLRDRGHGIAFQSTYNSDGTYGSEWHHYNSFGIRPIIRVKIQ